MEERSRRVTTLGVYGILLGILAGCADSSATVIDEVLDKSSSERAIALCRSWAGGGIAADDIVVAADSNLDEVAAIENRLELEADENVTSNPGSTYVALCVADGDLAAEFGQTTLLYYSMENGGGVHLAGQ